MVESKSEMACFSLESGKNILKAIYHDIVI